MERQVRTDSESCDRGFTLLELVVTVGIILMIVMTGSESLLSRRPAAVEASMMQFSQYMHLARMTALANSGQFDAADGTAATLCTGATVEVSPDTDPGNPGGTYVQLDWGRPMLGCAPTKDTETAPLHLAGTMELSQAGITANAFMVFLSPGGHLSVKGGSTPIATVYLQNEPPCDANAQPSVMIRSSTAAMNYQFSCEGNPR